MLLLIGCEGALPNNGHSATVLAQKRIDQGYRALLRLRSKHQIHHELSTSCVKKVTCGLWASSSHGVSTMTKLNCTVSMANFMRLAKFCSVPVKNAFRIENKKRNSGRRTERKSSETLCTYGTFEVGP